MTDSIIDIFADSAGMMVALLIFLATSTLALSLMLFLRSRNAIKRRAAGIGYEHSGTVAAPGALRGSSFKAAQKLIEYTTKHYSSTNGEKMKVLRRRMVQAGIYDARAVAYFFIARTALAVGVAVAVFVFLPLFTEKGGSFFTLMIMVGGMAGYIGPSMYIDRRIAARRNEHRTGFPDF